MIWSCAYPLLIQYISTIQRWLGAGAYCCEHLPVAWLPDALQEEGTTTTVHNHNHSAPRR